MTAVTILSQVGWDMSRWKTENNCVSWLKLCPDNKIIGGKIIGKGRMPTNNRATTALEMAASTLRASDSYRGAQFRRFRSWLGGSAGDQREGAKLVGMVFFRLWLDRAI